MEEKLLGAGVPRQRWSALLAGQMETVELINLALQWATLTWTETSKLFLESQQSVRIVELQRLEQINAVVADSRLSATL